MLGVEAIAWARQIMGEPGPHVRETVPGVLAATHSRYAAMQQSTGLSDASPYGLMWLGVPHALVESFRHLAGVQLFRPKQGRYTLPLVNGVPIIPWRYAKDGKTDLKATPFGQPVSAIRRALFAPPALPPELPLGEVGLGDAVIEELTVEQRTDLDSYAADIRELATEGLVAVLAYASNSDALINGYYGYATLGADGLLEWTPEPEKLDFTSIGTAGLRDVSSSNTRPTFDSGPLQNPKLRPRSPLENSTAGDDSPSPNPTGTNE